MSHFSVIQYLPDPSADERVNVGVIVVSGKTVEVEFLKDWSRAARFGGENIRFLKEFAERMKKAAFEQLSAEPLIQDDYRLNEDELKRISEGWIHSIQFTTPRASTLSPAKLVKDVAAQYLKESPEKAQRKTKGTAARLAANAILLALEAEKGEEASNFLKRNHRVEGRVEPHNFDIVVVNSRPVLATEGLSFDVSDSRHLNELIGSVAWKIEDVSRGTRKVPIAVAYLPSRKKSEEFERAEHLFGELSTPMIETRDLDDWAREILAKSEF